MNPDFKYEASRKWKARNGLYTDPCPGSIHVYRHGDGFLRLHWSALEVEAETELVLLPGDVRLKEVPESDLISIHLKKSNVEAFFSFKASIRANCLIELRYLIENEKTSRSSMAETRTAPTESGTAPTESGTAPTESGTAPTESGTAPTESGTAPTESETSTAESEEEQKNDDKEELEKNRRRKFFAEATALSIPPAYRCVNQDATVLKLLEEVEGESSTSFSLKDEVKKSGGARQRLEKLDDGQITSLLSKVVTGYRVKKSTVSAKKAQAKRSVAKASNVAAAQTSYSAEASALQHVDNISLPQASLDNPAARSRWELDPEFLFNLLSKPALQQHLAKILGKDGPEQTERELRDSAESADFLKMLTLFQDEFLKGNLTPILIKCDICKEAQDAAVLRDIQAFVSALAEFQVVDEDLSMEESMF